MQTTQQDFAATYRTLPDEEIAALCADIGSLTEPARSALTNETHQRGLSDAQLRNLHALELRHGSQFDRLEKYCRKRMVLRRLGLDDPKGWLFAVLGALVLILISKLISSRH